VDEDSDEELAEEVAVREAFTEDAERESWSTGTRGFRV
jgi:hypothetical protein